MDYFEKPSKKECIDVLEFYVKRLETLPTDVKYEPVRNADLAAVLRLIHEILVMDV